MPNELSTAPQGFTAGAAERLPMPPAATMTPEQRAAAQALIEGPRKGVYGPFLPLLRTPGLLDRVAPLGEHLRFRGKLQDRVRELVTCAVARHVSNQFEWAMHSPLARKAGVASTTIDALRAGVQPRGLPQDEQSALDFTLELLRNHGVSDGTYAAALSEFGEEGVVELTLLAGYFAMVSWLMNVARTPGPASDEPPLQAWPA